MYSTVKRPLSIKTRNSKYTGAEIAAAEKQQTVSADLNHLDGPYLVTVTSDAHEEVIWLYVSVDEVLCVHILDSTDHLERERMQMMT